VLHFFIADTLGICYDEVALFPLFLSCVIFFILELLSDCSFFLAQFKFIQEREVREVFPLEIKERNVKKFSMPIAKRTR
jgi:hypothetical protein